MHVKALSGDLIKELQGKASIEDTQQLFDAMQRQFVSHKEAHKALLSRVEAQGAAAETLADEASAASLQAAAALRGSEKLREETREWVRLELESRPTQFAVTDAATAAAEAALKAALAGEDGWLATQQHQLAIQGQQLQAQQQVLHHTSQQIRQAADDLSVTTATSAATAALAGTPAGGAAIGAPIGVGGGGSTTAVAAPGGALASAGGVGGTVVNAPVGHVLVGTSSMALDYP